MSPDRGIVARVQSNELVHRLEARRWSGRIQRFGFLQLKRSLHQLTKKIKSHLQTSLRASVEHRRAVFMGVDETVFEPTAYLAGGEVGFAQPTFRVIGQPPRQRGRAKFNIHHHTERACGAPPDDCSLGCSQVSNIT